MGMDKKNTNFVILHSDCQYDPSIMDRVLEPEVLKAIVLRKELWGLYNYVRC